VAPATKWPYALLIFLVLIIIIILIPICQLKLFFIFLLQPLLDERHREAAKRRGSASLSVSPATSRPSSRRTTPSRPPALLEPSSSPANDSARGPDVDDHHHQHKRHHGDHDNHHQADDYVEVDTSKRRKHEQQKHHHHHHRHEKASLASLSVPSTLGSSASALQHPTKSRPRGPLKRNPSRLHHLRVPDVGQDTLFLYQASTAPFQEKDEDEDEETMINEVEVVPQQQQRRNGQEARMVPAGFDPADVRKQLKPTGAGGGRGRGMGLGGFDASAARANLRSVAKDAQ
jgi:hypothetical protein